MSSVSTQPERKSFGDGIEAIWAVIQNNVEKMAAPILFLTFIITSSTMTPGAFSVEKVVIIIVQIVLDIAGAALVTKGISSRNAFFVIFGGLLITITATSALSGVVAFMFPALTPKIEALNNAVLIVRTLVSILYGVVMHAVKDGEKKKKDAAQQIVVANDTLALENKRQLLESKQRLDEMASDVKMLRDLINNKAANGIDEKQIESLVMEKIETRIAFSHQQIERQVESQNERQVESLIRQNERAIEKQIESPVERAIESLPQFKRTVSVELEAPSIVPNSKTAQRALKPAKKVSKQIEQKSESLSFDRKKFVYECLLGDVSMSAPAIVAKAKSEKNALSIGSVSNYRKAFFEEYPELSMLKVESQIESQIESLNEQENTLSIEENESQIERQVESPNEEIESPDLDQVESQNESEFVKVESLDFEPVSDEMPSIILSTETEGEPVLVD